ncbi:hypothetical protein AAFF_G00286350 [Aldrovandia affinis]|uniref:Uncharacterized protein n=1 Tax=Aldrovandia affinis TaxID=143900 RepID=A0AAD7TBQ9_9TELE|nr:hypothetical protein AAFF_G00286350 [Aldrovandia affinis]
MLGTSSHPRSVIAPHPFLPAPGLNAAPAVLHFVVVIVVAVGIVLDSSSALFGDGLIERQGTKEAAWRILNLQLKFLNAYVASVPEGQPARPSEIHPELSGTSQAQSGPSRNSQVPPNTGRPNRARSQPVRPNRQCGAARSPAARLARLPWQLIQERAVLTPPRPPPPPRPGQTPGNRSPEAPHGAAKIHAPSAPDSRTTQRSQGTAVAGH